MCTSLSQLGLGEKSPVENGLSERCHGFNVSSKFSCVSLIPQLICQSRFMIVVFEERVLRR